MKNIKKKVICWGVFDVLHQGHLDFLADAKSKGDILYVMIISDEMTRKLKGRLPKYTQKQRIVNIKKTGLVDHALPGLNSLKKNFELVFSLNPNVLVGGYDQNRIKEEKLKKYLKLKGLKTEFYISKEFAKGVHSSHLRKD